VVLAYHYTKLVSIKGIWREWALLPSPPLSAYGLNRQEVEAEPQRHGFRVQRFLGRTCYRNDRIPHPDGPGYGAAALWFKDERFVVSFTSTAAGWCHSALGHLPPESVDFGEVFRLTVDLAGLDVFPWGQYQQRTNAPAAYRRGLGDSCRESGDDLGEWYFLAAPVPLAGRLACVEQYHRGRWTSLEEVCDRAPLRQLYLERPDPSGPRREFLATFARTDTRGTHSLLKGVRLADGRLLADHVWVAQTWRHLRGGDLVQFFADVVFYSRGDRTLGYTLANVNGLRKVEALRPAGGG
jgi:hypothetical protein